MSARNVANDKTERSNRSAGAVATPNGGFRLLAFDLDVTGHHPSYLKYLATYWQQENVNATAPHGRSAEAGPSAGTPERDRLFLVVAPNFAEKHPTIAESLRSESVQLVPITAEEYAHVVAASSTLTRTQREWNVLKRYVQTLRPDHALLMYFDMMQPLLLTANSPGCDVSGIYFRPDFHYAKLPHSAPRNISERLQRLRKWATIQVVLRRPFLKNLFCLDPLCVGPLNQRGKTKKARWLPDPVQTYPISAAETATFRQSLGVAPGRSVLLVFGQLDDRKGLLPLFRALRQLSNQQAESWCLLLVGPLSPGYDATLQPALQRLRERSAVQIITRFEHVPEEAVQPYFGAADVITALYQRHIGMASVLVRAAAAGRPVLADQFGAVGEMVRRNALGLTVDAADPAAIAKQLAWLSTAAPPTDRAQMARFADENRADRFAETLIKTLLPHSHA